MSYFLMLALTAMPPAPAPEDVPPAPVYADYMPIPADDYAAARAAVERGESVLLHVRVAATHARPGWTTLRADDAPLADGVWECWRDGRGVPLAAPAITAPR